MVCFLDKILCALCVSSACSVFLQYAPLYMARDDVAGVCALKCGP